MQIPDPFWLTLAALLVLLLPGGALLVLLPRSGQGAPLSSVRWLALLGDLAALSLSISALAALWLSVAGIRLGGTAVVVLYALLAALVVAGLVRRGLPRPAGPVTLRSAALSLMGAALLVAAVIWRFSQARNLALPAWVDPVHHTLVVRKMLDYGGLPPDMTPYLPVPFFYHYGFHLSAALFAFWARLTPVQSVMWFGQVLNAAVGLSVFRLASVLVPAGADERTKTSAYARGAVAALLVTFAFQMPAYYLTWGRYTLLAGLVVTGPAMAAAWELFHNPSDRRLMVKFFVLTAGLFVTHYLAALMVGLFLAVLGLVGAWRAYRLRSFRAFPWALVALGLAGIVVTLPWLWRVWINNPTETGVQMVFPSGAVTTWFVRDTWSYLLYLWGPRRNYILLALSATGALFALRQNGLRSLVAWALALLALSAPWGLRLGPFRPDLFNIVIFFPAAILLGDLLVSACAALGTVTRPLFNWAALALVTAGLVLWGRNETANIINPATVIATPADVAALGWIKDHTPQDARFLINSVIWQTTVYRGVDGGYWLLPYTGRFSLVPTSVYEWGSRDYYLLITGWAKRSQAIKGCTPDFWELVRDARLTHIYLRVGAGSIQPGMFADCPRVQKIYESGGIFLYEIASVP